MRLLLIRHGEPDYSIDSLTEKGWREAQLLAERLSKMEIASFYVSPLGRARDTAAPTLERMGRCGEECQWLREFAPKILRPDRGREAVAWDWLPGEWTRREEFFDRDAWWTPQVMRDGRVKEEYDWVTSSFDGILARHGYEREGKLYRAVKPNGDTLAFFCHFGVECVLLSHLMNVSPMILWHGMCAAPSSVTTVVTEERRKGAASFRMGSFGDTSHLYAAGETPSFAARFCERYENWEERHD